MRKAQAALALLLALVAAGCDGELVGDAGMGEISTVVRDREPPETQGGVAGPAVIQGTVTMTLSAELIGYDGRIVPITDGLRTVVAPIATHTGFLADRDSVPVGGYGLVRLTFTKVEADITGGLGALTGLVTVDIFTEPLVREVPIAIIVDEGSEHSILLTFNAEAWLPTVDSRRIRSTAFLNSLGLRAEPGVQGLD